MEILIPKSRLKILFVSLGIISFVNGYIVNENPYRHREVLDDKGNYILEWEYVPSAKTLLFNVTVHCSGFVGLGLAKRGSMMNADFVIAGVNQDGTAYCKDMHTKGNRTLIRDKKQDWTLLEASEEGGTTCLSFSRLVNTCDEDDLEITEGRTVILWAYGENDTLGYHYNNRGFKDAYLLDPNFAPKLELDSRSRKSYRSDEPKAEVWSLRRTSRLERKPTSYFCSIHRGMGLSRKHHVIGYRTYLENEVARRHTHHFVVYKCQAPDGVDAKSVFEPFIDYPGEECHFSENRRLPYNFCRRMLFVWGVGGEPLFLNENIGMSVDPSDEYIMFETHFDNRELRLENEFEVGVDFYITPKLRPNDGSMLTIGYAVDGPNQVFPPASIDFNSIGQCDSECTELMFPQRGVQISEVFLHAHQSATRLYLRHFRNSKELPPILTDDNYNPTYQQYRNLKKPVTVLPGDHLVMECVLDNSQYNGTTVGGFGTHQEMCVAFVTVDAVIDRRLCVSEYPAYRMLSQLGVNNVTWDTYLQDRVVTSPASLRGLTLGEVSDRHIKWTSDKRRLLENDMMYAAHAVTCPDASVPSIEEIIQEAKEQVQLNSNRNNRRNSNGRRKDGQVGAIAGRIPSVTYSGTGFSRIENDPRLQRQVQRAAEQQLKYGSISLLGQNDPGSLVMRASTGNPILLERFSASGLTGRGAPATTRFPPNAKESQRKNGGEKCKKERKDEAGIQFLRLVDLQEKVGLNTNYFPSVPTLAFGLGK